MEAVASGAPSVWRMVGLRSRWPLDAHDRYPVSRPGWVSSSHRGTAIRHVRGVGLEAVLISVSEPEFPLVADLRSAQQSVTLQLYYGAPGRTAATLQQILLERAKAGVRVFVLYDAFGTTDIPEEHRNALREGGVVVEPFRPLRVSTLHLAQNRSHVRGIVVDGRIGWTGGFGIDDKWLGDGRTNGSWRETNVRFEGPAVRQLQAAFAAAWVEATGVLFTGRATLAPQENGVLAAGLLYTAPTLGSTAAGRFFALSIAGARKTLYITNAYFAPDRSFIEMLVAAARRGVDVRILTAGPRTDVPIVRLAGRAWYDTLLSGGVRVYEWQLDAARKDVRHRWRMAHNRIDELRQPVDGTQR